MMPGWHRKLENESFETSEKFKAIIWSVFNITDRQGSASTTNVNDSRTDRFEKRFASQCLMISIFSSANQCGRCRLSSIIYCYGEAFICFAGFARATFGRLYVSIWNFQMKPSEASSPEEHQPQWNHCAALKNLSLERWHLIRDPPKCFEACPC